MACRMSLSGRCPDPIRMALSDDIANSYFDEENSGPGRRVSRAHGLTEGEHGSCNFLMLPFICLAPS